MLFTDKIFSKNDFFYLGIIRDLTGSYTKCIYIINLVTFITVMMWTIEVICLKIYKSKCQLRDGEQQN